jgi:hypothetical protein
MFDDPITQQNPFDLICHLAEDRHIGDWSCFERGESGNITFKNSMEFESLASSRSQGAFGGRACGLFKKQSCQKQVS